MFVSRKKYDKLVAQYATETMALALKIIELSGENLQLRGTKKNSWVDHTSQFTEDEIKTLITLCHPDKHGGKDSAHRMTQKLLQLRK